MVEGLSQAGRQEGAAPLLVYCAASLHQAVGELLANYEQEHGVQASL